MAALKNHILVPIDFSEQSLIALKQSYNLARLTKADITLINVIEESFFDPIFGRKEDKGLEKKILKALDKLAQETSHETGIRVHTQISRGKVYDEIKNTAKKLKCSFIVMGTSGGSGGLKRFIGSNSLRVIREASCPVITIKGKKHRPGCRNIVLPLDLTKETKEKVKKAIDLARLFGSKIDLVSILNTDDEFIVNKLKRQMQQVLEYVEKQEVSCSTEFIQGDDISDEIIKYAKKIKADLIMIMTQQESNWSDIMFISSSAQEIINNSDIPVLCIRPTEKKGSSLSVFEY
jgi:nucleotide-binding universal stress UspA family protein